MEYYALIKLEPFTSFLLPAAVQEKQCNGFYPSHANLTLEWKRCTSRFPFRLSLPPLSQLSDILHLHQAINHPSTSKNIRVHPLSAQLAPGYARIVLQTRRDLKSASSCTHY